MPLNRNKTSVIHAVQRWLYIPDNTDPTIPEQGDPSIPVILPPPWALR